MFNVSNLSGVFTALITPFTEDGSSVDYEALKRIIHFQLENGISGLVPCGTTGESPTLSHDEHEKVVQKTVLWAKECNKNAIVIAGTGSNNTKEAIELTKMAYQDGADYAMVVNPYYNKPPQQGLIEHFTKIAEASKIPIVLYNIPGRSSVSLDLKTIQLLAKHPNICAIKEATGDLNFMSQVIHATENNFPLLSGDDNLTLPVLSIGGSGLISVLSNVYPLQVSKMVSYFLKDANLQKTKELHYKMLPLFKAMFCETNPLPIKYAAYKKGMCYYSFRLPLTQLQKQNQDFVDKAMQDFEKDI